MSDLPFPVTTPAIDVPSAVDLRDAVVTTRSRLLEVLYARARALTATTTWTGPHRDRYDAESQALLDAGRDLDDQLAGLLHLLDDELDRARAIGRITTAGEAGPLVPGAEALADASADLPTNADAGAHEHAVAGRAPQRSGSPAGRAMPRALDTSVARTVIPIRTGVSVMG